MDHLKILKLLNEASYSKFLARKCFHDQLNASYDTGNEIIYNTELLKFNLCNYNDVYILVRG